MGVNYDKSIIVPINTPHIKMLEPASILGCSVGSMPFTYLGLPLSLSKLKLGFCAHFAKSGEKIDWLLKFDIICRETSASQISFFKSPNFLHELTLSPWSGFLAQYISQALFLEKTWGGR